MKTISSLLILLLFSAGSLISYAQAPSWSGLYSFGGDLPNRGKAVLADQSNVFMASQISGTTTFDGVSYTSVGYLDMLLVKSSLSGISVWKKQISPTSSDGFLLPSTIKTDTLKNIYIVGRFGGTVTIGGSTITSGTDFNSFVAKFDSNGNGIWATPFYNAVSAYGTEFNRIAIDGTGNLYIISRSNLLLKYSNSGVKQWEQYYPNKTLLTVAVKDTALYLGGQLVQATTYFGTLPLSKIQSGYNNGFLVKGDLNGNYYASKVFSGIAGVDGSSVSDIVFDNSNNIILTGVCSKQTIFGTITINNPSSYLYNYIAKCDNNFNFSWVKSSTNYNTLRETVGYRIFLDNTNNISLIGIGFPSITFNGITATNPINSYYFQFASDGTALAGYNLPFALPTSTHVNTSGSIFFAGNSTSTFGNILYTSLSSNTTPNWSLESSLSTSASVSIIYTKKDNAGNIYTLASFSGNGTYFGNTVSASSTAVHLLTKCDASGNSIWMKQIEGYAGISQQGSQLYIDKDSNVLFTGTFANTFTIGNTTFTNQDANKDGFIAVFAPDGTVSMLKQIVSPDLDHIDCIIEDNSGNMIISGIGKNLTLNGLPIANLKNNDVFLLKLNPSGTLNWANFYSGDGSIGADYMALVASDENDNLFLSGEFHSNPCDFGNISLNLPDGSGSVILAKIDKNGYTIWAKSFSGVAGQPNDGWPDFMKTDTAGNTIMYGWAPNNANFDNITLTNPLGTGFSYFISKINTNGDVVWVRAIFQKNFDFNYGDNLDLDKSGNIYVAGHVKDDISINGSVYPKVGARELFVAKYNNAGTFLWIKKVTSSGSGNLINGISVFGNDSILVAGSTATPLTFGNSIVNTKGSTWGYLAVLDGSNPLTGTKTINPAGGDYTSFSSAISDLNNLGVGSGGVTFQVASNAIFTDVNQIITATGTLANPIRFIKSGAGANPVIKSKGVANSGTDFFIKIPGGDYITFDGIDFATDPTALDKEKIETVMALYGNQHITIQNCTVNQQASATTSFTALVFNTQTFQSTSGGSKFITIKNVTFKFCNAAINFTGNTLNYISDIEVSNCQFGTAAEGLFVNSNIVGLTKTTNINIHHNTFQNITTDYMAFAIGGTIGIGLNQVYNNRIFNIISTHTGDEYFDLMGIYITMDLHAKIEIYNNLIYDFDAPNADIESNRYFNLTPIFISGTGSANVFNNTVKMSSVNPKISSTTIWVNGKSVVKNNIFVNTSVANTNAFSTIASSSITDVFSNNITYIDTTLSGHSYNGSIPVESFYNRVYSGGDINSHINANVNPNLDVNLIPQNPSPASDNAGSLPRAATDFNGVTRTGFDLGAFEGNFGTQKDIWFPAIKFNAVENTTLDTVRLLASITDNFGVSASPKLWFRKSGSALAFTSISGIYNAGSQLYSFTFPTLSSGDYEYFVCAKDAAGNIISNPAVPGLSLANAGLLVNNPAAGSITTLRFEYKMALVNTNEIYGITNTTANCGGTIRSDLGSPITSKGICWKTTSSPTISDSKTIDGSGTGTFTSNLTGLSPNTFYYVRAYATNSIGTSYGEETTFRTLATPNLNMNNLPVTTCYGNFYDSGGAAGNYPDNQDFTKVFSPPVQGYKMSVTFNSFDTEQDFDLLYIFDGPDIYSPQVMGSPFSGTQSIGTITASSWNWSGALTFRFASDAGLNFGGWNASISVPVTEVYTNLYPNPACPNSTVNLGASGPANNYSFLWDFGDGNSGYSQSYENYSYLTAGTYPVSVKVFNTCGAETTLYDVVQVSNNLPVGNVNLNVSSTSVCPNEEISFNVFGDGGSYNYLWNFGDGSPASTSPNIQHFYPTLGSYAVSVKITNACGKDTILYQTINVVNNIPVSWADAGVTPSTVCPTDRVDFNAWGSDGYTYTWNFGDGSPITNEQYTSHSYTTAGTYPTWVKVTNLCGMETYIYRTVQVANNIPVTTIDYNISPNPVCPSDEVSFRAYGISAYVWSFGDGSPNSTRQEVYHKYAAAGSYPVSITLTNGCGNSTTMNETVLVSNGLPVTNVNLYIDPNPVCPNDQVSFDISADATSYSWNFGDGQPGTNSEYTYHSYTSAGSYEVSVTATNSCGNDTTIYETIMVMNNLPVSNVNLYVNPNPVCPNDEVTFEVSGNESYSYEWNFGDGGPVAGNSNAYHTYTSVGNYNVSVKVTNACGNDTILYTTVQVLGNLPASYYDIQIAPNPVCPNGTVSFQAWSSSDTYLWTFGDGSLSSNKGRTNHVYSTPGTYPVSLKVTNGCGNSTVLNQSLTVQNNIIPFPDDYDYAVLQSEACPNDSIVFYVQNGAGTYLWDFGDGTSSSVTTPFEAEDGYMVDMSYHSYSTPGNYVATLTVTNQCGNSFSDQFSILVGNNLPVSGEFGWNLSNPKVGETIEFWAYGGSTYQFDFGDGSAPVTITTDLEKIQHMYSAPGSYNISVVISNSCGKSATYYDNVIVTGSLAIPSVAGVISGITELCRGQNSVVYTVPPIMYAMTYDWTMPTGATGISSTNTITVNFGALAVSGNITVKGTNPLGSGALSLLAVSLYNKPPTPVITINGNMLHSNAINGNQWYSENGPIDGAVGPDYLATANGNYYVIATPLGCSSDPSNIIPKFFLCDAQFSYTWDGFAHFTDLSTGGPTSWSWDFGDGSYSILPNPNHNYAKNGAYMVTLTVFNKLNNCVSTITQKVIAGVENPCQAEFGYTINSVSGLASFASLSTGETAYYWDFGDGDYSIVPNTDHTFKKAGFYTVCLTIWNDTTGCQSSICKDILFIPESVNFVKADFSYFTDSADSTVVFSDLSTSNATAWYWTMGDGKIMNTQNPVYSYSKPGIYEVCLTAFDEVNLLSNTACKLIRVSSIPCAIGADFSTFIVPATREVSFFCNATGSITDYYWTFGDGGSSSLENPAHQYAAPGYYMVTLMVRNKGTKCMDSYSQFIQVGSVDCLAGFTFGVDKDMRTVYFTDNSKGQIDYYYWDFSDGDFSVDQNPEKLYSKAGMYLVGQTVIDNTNGCMDFSYQQVQVGEIDCSADFVSYFDSANNTGYFTNRILGEATALLWSFGDGKFSTKENPVHLFPGEGIYSVGLNTYDFNTECMDYYEEMLVIGGIGNDCEADFAYGVDPTNPEVLFSNQSIGDIVSTVWNFGEYGSDNSVEANPVHTYIKGGYYNVCLTVTNSSGISNMRCKWVLVQGSVANDCRANFMFSIDSTTRKVTFADNSYGSIDRYTWDFGDSRSDSISIAQNPTHTYDQQGYYLVQLKAENTVSGCVSSEYKLLNVADAQILKAAFGYEAKDPDKKFTGYPVDLVSASSGDGATVEWDFGDKQLKKGAFTVMDSTSRILTHYYEKPGKYEVCLRISDPVSGQSDTYCSSVYTKNAVKVNYQYTSGINLDIYPNPFIDNTTISYSIPESQFVEIAIFDQLGRRIETLVKTKKDSGTYQLDWETKSHATGVYHLKMFSTEGILTKQFVITK
jgi:PKD repeat protein